MVSEDPSQRSDGRTRILISLLFGVALIFHVWGVSVGWKSLNLPGCEFRQAQTAISTFFIQKDHDFSLAYPTPVLGKPWSIPMEFPLYQWTVVALSDRTGWSLTSSARAVSAICFYLSLPALYLLLARIGLTWPRRLLVLGLMLTCPLYIFYTRAFLIETMALMFGCWFLWAYISGVEKRSFWRVAVGIIAGAACGLVKVTSFLFFLMPAFVWTILWFVDDWKLPRAQRVAALIRRTAWCAAVVAIPFAASIWWVKYTDMVKGHSIAGKFLQSSSMSPYHFGTGVRFSPDIWNQHWYILFHYIASVPVLLGCAVLAFVYARKWLWLILSLVGMFFVVQLVFPILYAWHEYYYVTNAFALIVALGLALCGLLDSRARRVVVWVVILAVYGLQGRSYLGDYYKIQKGISPGGTDLTAALKRVTAPDEVLVIAGNDWSSITPYFAQRRAFMIRSQLEKTWDMIHPAFQALKGESVTALVLCGEQVNNVTLRDLAVSFFHIDPRPVFQWKDVQVYLHKDLRASAIPLLKGMPNIELLEVDPNEPDPQLNREIWVENVLPRFQTVLDSITPKPYKYYTTYGLTFIEQDGQNFLNGHPHTRFWFKLAKGSHQFSVDAEIAPGAYDAKVPHDDQTDGVVFTMEAEKPDGSRRPLFSRYLNPRDLEADRGLQHIAGKFNLDEDSSVVFSIGPGPRGNFSRDWTLLRDLKIQ